MDGTTTPRVKICCIASTDEVKLAVRYGASAVGLVSAMPSGPGVIDEQTIANCTKMTPPGVASFLLTSIQSAAGIIEQQRQLRANTIQICDHLTDGTYEHLREQLPGISLVQVIHVTGEESIEEALAVQDKVDAILLDSGNPKLAVKELGGTGRRHNWSISKRIREALRKPMFLAGGLNPQNVREAIETVGPYGLDICSGVRTAGRLDEEKLREFFKNVGLRA